MKKNIVKTLDAERCCGCGACYAVCPKQCILMKEDKKGFLRPQVNRTDCIECGKCGKVCPALHPAEKRVSLEVWGARNKDEEVRMASSSGGVFYAIAEYVISQGGVVFGARFDERWEVVHDYADTINGVKDLMGSKYSQSRMDDCYRKVKEFVGGGRLVLFTGTGCQIAGLKHFLGRDYENLITVDVVCHGVPSPLVWRNYLVYTRRRNAGGDGKAVWSSLNDLPSIEGISFRDKTQSWKKFGLVFRFRRPEGATEKFGMPSVKFSFSTYENLYVDLFMRGFLSNIYLRPCCHNCAANGGRSTSDMTIGDYWSMPEYLQTWDDDRGTSLVLAYTEKGIHLLKKINLELRESTYKDALVGNRTIESSYPKHVLTDWFWTIYPLLKEKAIELCCNLRKPPLVHVVARKIYHLIKKQ